MPNNTSAERIKIVIRDYREDEMHHVELEKDGRCEYSINNDDSRNQSAMAFQPGVIEYISNIFSRSGKYDVEVRYISDIKIGSIMAKLQETRERGFDINIAEPVRKTLNHNYRRHV